MSGVSTLPAWDQATGGKLREALTNQSLDPIPLAHFQEHLETLGVTVSERTIYRWIAEVTG